MMGVRHTGSLSARSSHALYEITQGFACGELTHKRAALARSLHALRTLFTKSRRALRAENSRTSGQLWRQNVGFIALTELDTKLVLTECEEYNEDCSPCTGICWSLEYAVVKETWHLFTGILLFVN